MTTLRFRIGGPPVQNSLRFAVVFVAAILELPILSAATIRVPEDRPTIASAIRAASDGDVIDVAPGTYVLPPSTTIGSFSYSLIVDKSITLKSRRLYQAVLDGGGTSTVLILMRASASVEGFVLRNAFKGIQQRFTSEVVWMARNLIFTEMPTGTAIEINQEAEAVGTGIVSNVVINNCDTGFGTNDANGLTIRNSVVMNCRVAFGGFHHNFFSVSFTALFNNVLRDEISSPAITAPISVGPGMIERDPRLINVRVDGAQLPFFPPCGSPLVDAGDPNLAFNDQSFPPSLGGVRNDVGAYGGPGAALQLNEQTSTAILEQAGCIVGLSTGQPVIYVSNQGSNTVSVIQTPINTLARTVPLSRGPQGIAASLDGTRVYVAAFDANSVSVIRTSDNTVLGSIPVGTGPNELAITPDGSRVYVTNFRSNTVSVVETRSNQVISTVRVGLAPSGITIAPDGSRAYVTNLDSNNLSIIDVRSNTVAATIPAGTGPEAVAITPDGRRAYVVNARSNNVSVVDTVNNSVITGVPVGNNPLALAVSPDGTRIYVTNSSSNNVSVISASTNRVASTIAVGQFPIGIALSPSGRVAYVANFNSGSVSVVRIADNTVVGTIAVGVNPVGVTLTVPRGEAIGQPPPTISSGGVVNGASFLAGSMAPGTIVSIFGTGLADSTAVADTLPLRTRLSGTSVSMNGIPFIETLGPGYQVRVFR